MIWLAIIVDSILVLGIRFISIQNIKLKKEIQELRKSNQELLQANYNLTTRKNEK